MTTRAGLAEAYQSGDSTPDEETERALTAIALLEPTLNAFQVVDADGARAAAAQSTARWKAGRLLRPLDGWTVTIKDTVDMAGQPTRAGSRVTPATPATADSPAVARLRAAGCVILGKTTTPEFGWKGITDSPLRGAATRNPWNPARSSGGSSGGACAALAAGIGALAHGTDGGGSIRLPAAYCGVFGLKPTYGRVPHHPTDSPFQTIATGGPIARDIPSLRWMLAVLAGPDDRDQRAAPPPAEDWLDVRRGDIVGLRVAWSADLGRAEPDEAVRAACAMALAALRDLGAIVTEVGPVIEPLIADFADYWIAGFADRLRTIPVADRDLLDPGFRRLAEQGLAVGLEAVVAAETKRMALGRRFAELLRDHDLLATPSTPSTAPAADVVYHSATHDRWRDAIPYTLPFNLTGQPALSLPCGLAPDGMPVGFQLVGRRFAEAALLDVAELLARALPALPPPPLHAGRPATAPTVQNGPGSG
jgi:aspartyl-tRNA(Asn)/glutamyl-tRNA(Gln) amidotransferase subunit A